MQLSSGSLCCPWSISVFSPGGRGLGTALETSHWCPLETVITSC